jgi:hypothetical protein
VGGCAAEALAVTVSGMHRHLRTALTALLTIAFGVSIGCTAANAGITPPPVTSGCAEYGERSVSTGTVVRGAYRIAAFCFDGTAERGVLRISGRVTGGGTGTCAVAYVRYRTPQQAPRIEVGRVCGSTAAVTSSVVRSVSVASIEACLVHSTGATIRCSGSNVVLPAGPRTSGPAGPRR